MMPGLSDDELGNYLDEVIRATQEGLISWTTANPTTFVWDKLQAPRARLSFQEIKRQKVSIEGGRRVVKATFLTYVLQVFELREVGGGAYQLVQREEIDGSQNDLLNEKMRVLFNFIRNAGQQKDLEFLRGTLPRPKS